MSKPTVYVVHCIDTEGPLDERPEATVAQVNQIFGLSLEPGDATLQALQEGRIDLGEHTDAVRRIVAPSRLAYMRNWTQLDEMLDDALSTQFRRKTLDDIGGGWVFSWHCVDHLGLEDNPRRKAYGYGAIFDHYSKRASDGDEINWHFHPLSLARDAVSGASSFLNSWDVLSYTLCRRILDDRWFPVVNRPGFHTERPDSHAFLEQWIPFDYANQRHDDRDSSQKDLQHGRFGDWSRAPTTWAGYHPHHDDHESEGQCRRWIFRCLNIGTRLRNLQEKHVREAFAEAGTKGSAILAFADHDYRDLRLDVDEMRRMLAKVRPDFPGVAIEFAGAEAAARAHLQLQDRPSLTLSAGMEEDRFVVKVETGAVFGPQPFLAIKTKQGSYHHDNFDVIEPNRVWSYFLDRQTLPLDAVAEIGVGAAGDAGGFDTQVLRL